MNLKNVTKIRIEFRKNIEITSIQYETKILKKYSSQDVKEYMKKMQINKNNYIFFNYIQWKNYVYSLNFYRDNFYNKNIENNEILKIILLFYPYLLKSVTGLYDCIKDDDNIKLENFSLKDKELQNDIINFINVYKQFESSGKMFHRDNLFNYMEIFLNIYVLPEIEIINNNEKQNLILYHYFRPFLRPELYFTVSSLKEINSINNK